MIRTIPADHRDRLGLDDPARRLLATVVTFALRDVLYGSPRHAADAAAYLRGPNFAADCKLLDLKPGYILNLLHDEEEFMRTLLTDDEARRLHARYVNERLTIEQLARELTLAKGRRVYAASLSRIFARLGLPTRRPGPGPDQAAPADLRQLGRLLDNLADDGRVTVHIHVHIQENPS